MYNKCKEWNREDNNDMQPRRSTDQAGEAVLGAGLTADG